MTDSEFVPPTVGHEVWSDGSPRWVFCDNPECLLCATKSPRRDAPTEPLPDRDSQVARIADAFGVPLGLVDDRVIYVPERQPFRFFRAHLRIYFEPRDVWIGAYVAKGAIYVCPLPCIVICWLR